jgi:translation elongation factor EF-1beta
MVEYNVAVDIKIFMEDPAKTKTVEKSIAKLAKTQNARVEDGPFGIKILRMTILLNDEKGGMDELEERIRAIGGVSQVETENVSRV